MSEPLFMFLAHGIAAESTWHRAGARHALMLYAKGTDITAARLAAVAEAANKGWTFVDVQREKEIDADASVIEDDVLRSAAEDAVKIGSGIVVYGQELALDG